MIITDALEGNMESKFNIVYRSGRFSSLGSEVVVALLPAQHVGPGLHAVVSEWHPEFHHDGEVLYPERLSTLILFPGSGGDSVSEAVKLANTWDEDRYPERATA